MCHAITLTYQSHAGILMKENIKKNIRSTLFLLGFFMMPNIFFILPVIYNEVAEEQIYQEAFGSKQHKEHVNIYLKFENEPGAKEQREIDIIIGKMQTKLHNKHQGKLVHHQFDSNGVHFKLSGENADDLLESAIEVFERYEVQPGSYARKIYHDKEPVSVDL